MSLYVRAKLIIETRPDRWEKVKDSITTYSDREIESRYIDHLDEIFGQVTIAAYSYSTSDALRSVDPTAYRCGLSDWISDDDFVEIDGITYDARDLETAIDEIEEAIERDTDRETES